MMFDKFNADVNRPTVNQNTEEVGILCWAMPFSLNGDSFPAASPYTSTQGRRAQNSQMIRLICQRSRPCRAIGDELTGL
jgi:hypothetical protein